MYKMRGGSHVERLLKVERSGKLVKKEKNDRKKNQPEKLQASTMHVPVPKVSSTSIMAVDSDDDMSDYN
jgi:hypothetical protein